MKKIINVVLYVLILLIISTNIASASGLIIAIDPYSKTINSGESVTYSIEVRDDQEVMAVPYTTIAIDDDAKGLCTSVTTNSNGIATYTTNPTSSGYVYFTASKSGYTTTSNSIATSHLTVNEPVSQSLIMAIDPYSKTINSGESVTYSIEVRDFQEVLPVYGVTVQIQDQAKGVTTSVTTNSNGIATYTTTPTSSGYVYFTASKLGYDTDDNSIATSYLTVNEPVSQSLIMAIDPYSKTINSGESVTYSIEVRDFQEVLPVYGVTVQIQDQAKGVTTSVTTNSNGIATYTTTPTSSGYVYFTASKSGYDADDNSIATSYLTVNAKPTLSISASPTSKTIISGDSASFSFTVKDQNGNSVSSATVQIQDQAKGITKSVTTNSYGVVTYSTNPTSSGYIYFTASKTGYTSSSSNKVYLTVNAKPTLSISASPTSKTIISGDSASFSFTVKDQNGNSVSSATVQIQDQAKGITKSVTTNSYGVVTYSTNPTSSGYIYFTASKTGYTSSSSNKVYLTVNTKPTLSISASSTSKTIISGDSASFSFTVKDQDGNSVSNAIVAIDDDAKGLCTSVTTNSYGVATYSTNPTSSGYIYFTASKTGYTSSSSNKVYLTVNTELTIPPSPSVSTTASSFNMEYGQAKKITFTIKNNGGDSTAESYLTTSVSSGLEIIDYYSSSSSVRFGNMPPSSFIWTSSNNNIVSDYQMLDAFQPYSAGSSATVTITVKAKSAGPQWIKYRTAFSDGNTFYRMPNSGSKDQQGWYAYTITGDVSQHNSNTIYLFADSENHDGENIASIGAVGYGPNGNNLAHKLIERAPEIVGAGVVGYGVGAICTYSTGACLLGGGETGGLLCIPAAVCVVGGAYGVYELVNWGTECGPVFFEGATVYVISPDENLQYEIADKLSDCEVDAVVIAVSTVSGYKGVKAATRYMGGLEKPVILSESQKNSIANAYDDAYITKNNAETSAKTKFDVLKKGGSLLTEDLLIAEIKTSGEYITKIKTPEGFSVKISKGFYDIVTQKGFGYKKIYGKHGPNSKESAKVTLNYVVDSIETSKLMPHADNPQNMYTVVKKYPDPPYPDKPNLIIYISRKNPTPDIIAQQNALNPGQPISVAGDVISAMWKSSVSNY